MSLALFVTGTDTGVGKTVVAAALAAALHRRGYRVGVMKPVESGCPRVDGRLLPRDAEFLREVSGCRASVGDVTPYALAAPLAPALAGEMEGIAIDFERIRGCFRRIAAAHDATIIEGAGGLLTPLTPSLVMRDLALSLSLPIVVVARNVLGAINHAALTVEAATRAGLEVLGIVLNSTGPGSDRASSTNPDALRRWGGAPLIGQVPYIPASTLDALAEAGERLLQGGAWGIGRIDGIPAGEPSRTHGQGTTGW